MSYINLCDKLNLPDKFKNIISYSVKFIETCCTDNLYAIILFGSCSRSEYKCTSDVDLLILTFNPIDSESKLCVRYDLLDNKIGPSVDTVFYTVEDFNKSSKPLIKNIRKDGVVVWIRDKTHIIK